MATKRDTPKCANCGRTCKATYWYDKRGQAKGLCSPKCENKYNAGEDAPAQTKVGSVP